MESNGKPAGGSEMVKVPSKEPLRLPDLVLRVLVLALTMAAAVVMSMARETKTVPFTVAPTLPALPVAVLAKSTYSSAFTYFIAANAIVCMHTALSIVLSIKKRGSSARAWSLLLIITDVIMVALLCSACGAAAAIGEMGENGNSHIGWNKICGVFSRFCVFIKASVVVSVASSMFYLIVIVLSVVNLHGKSL